VSEEPQAGAQFALAKNKHGLLCIEVIILAPTMATFSRFLSLIFFQQTELFLN
jgi:hypothetical protein